MVPRVTPVSVVEVPRSTAIGKMILRLDNGSVQNDELPFRRLGKHSPTGHYFMVCHRRQRGSHPRNSIPTFFGGGTDRRELCILGLGSKESAASGHGFLTRFLSTARLQHERCWAHTSLCIASPNRAASQGWRRSWLEA